MEARAQPVLYFTFRLFQCRWLVLTAAVLVERQMAPVKVLSQATASAEVRLDVVRLHVQIVMFRTSFSNQLSMESVRQGSALDSTV